MVKAPALRAGDLRVDPRVSRFGKSKPETRPGAQLPAGQSDAECVEHYSQLIVVDRTDADTDLLLSQQCAILSAFLLIDNCPVDLVEFIHLVSENIASSSDGVMSSDGHFH